MDRPPNLLFLFPDQWRGDWLTQEGVALRTPHLDHLVRNGTRYTQCRTNSPLCIPARACLSQGLRWQRNGAPDNSAEMPPDRTTFFQILRRQGYRVMSCGKSDVHGHSRFFHDSGWHPMMGRLGFTDCIDQRGKLNSARPPANKPGPYVAWLRANRLLESHMDDYGRRWEFKEPNRHNASWPTPLPREAYCDDFAGRSALQLLDRTPPEAPWFLWVNFPGPHDPWDPPAELQARTAADSLPGPIDGQPGFDHPSIRRSYAAMISGIDDWIGRIVDAVRRRGELDNTLIVFCSDHGEMLGDHGRWNKSVWFEGSVRVPLVLCGPGVEAGKVDHRLVELIDLAPTFLEHAGCAWPEGWDAQPLSAPPRSWQHSALAESHSGGQAWEMACDGRWKLVCHLPASREELFDLQSDPHEQQCCRSAFPQEADRLRGLLQQYRDSLPT